MILTTEKESPQSKTGPNISLSTKNPTWTALILDFEILRTLLIKIFILLVMFSCILVYKYKYFLNLKIQVFWDVAPQTGKIILKYEMTIIPSSGFKKYFHSSWTFHLQTCLRYSHSPAIIFTLLLHNTHNFRKSNSSWAALKK